MHGIAVDRYAVPEEDEAICGGECLSGNTNGLRAIHEAAEIADAGGSLGTDLHGKEEQWEPMTRSITQTDAIQDGINEHRQVLQLTRSNLAGLLRRSDPTSHDRYRRGRSLHRDS